MVRFNQIVKQLVWWPLINRNWGQSLYASFSQLKISTICDQCAGNITQNPYMCPIWASNMKHIIKNYVYASYIANERSFEWKTINNFVIHLTDRYLNPVKRFEKTRDSHVFQWITIFKRFMYSFSNHTQLSQKGNSLTKLKVYYNYIKDLFPKPPSRWMVTLLCMND